MEKKSMGSFLTALRKANGLTQKQLAEKLNVSDKAISRWERDECAPDLSLIPVLAEIYGVTSDEILQGQRIAPDKLHTENDNVKVAKQRNRILKSTKTKFICRSLVSVTTTLVGLILAYILNVEFEKANAGFMLGSIFFITASVGQVLFLIMGFTSLTDVDWHDPSVEGCKGFMLLTGQWCLGIIGAAIGLSIPLVGKNSISFADCVFSAMPWLLGITAVFLVLWMIINRTLKRKGIIDWKQPLNMLRLRCSTAMACIILILLGLQSGMNHYLTSHRNLYAEHSTVTSLSSFRDVMEQPVSEYGDPMVEIATDSDIPRVCHFRENAPRKNRTFLT